VLKVFAPAHSEGQVNLALRLDGQTSPTTSLFEYRPKEKEVGLKRIREVVHEGTHNSDLSDREYKVRIIERLG
jgi:hypothetical protein